MTASPLRYSLLAALSLLPCAVLAAAGDRAPLGLALVTLPAVALPVWMGFAYRAAAARVDARSRLREGERPVWAPLLGGALRLHLAGAGLGLLAAASVAAALVAGGWAAWGWLAAVALLVWPAARLLARPLGALRAYGRLAPVLAWAPALAALPLALAWAGLGLLAGPGGTWGERVAAAARYEGESVLLGWAVDAAAAAGGLRGLAEDWTAAQGAGAALAVGAWRLAAAAAQFALWGLLLAPALLPAGEARRILSPSGADAAEPVGALRLGLAAALGTVVLIALGRMLLLAEGEAAALQARASSPPAAMTEAPALGGPSPQAGATAARPGAPAAGPDPAPPSAGAPPALTPAALREAVEAEAVGDLLCDVGTLARLEAVEAGLAAAQGRIRDATREGFAAMRANVPAYLDWHYSLRAEYARTGHLLIGDGTEYLAGRVEGFLLAGEPLAPVEAALAEARAALPAAEGARAALLAGCRPALPRDDAAVTVTALAPAALLAPPASIPFEARLGASGAGAVAGALAGSMMAKVAVSAGFKAVAAALAKAAAAKGAGLLGGIALGAGAGAAGGSVVPGLGTAVGGVVGGILGGLGVSVAVDAALVELDEAVTREAYEAELLAAIDAAEAEALAALGD